MKWYLKVVRDNYANFSGRARRQEYWMFFLFNMIFTFLFMFVGVIFGNTFDTDLPMSLAGLQLVYGLAIIIPSIAVAVRRLHDIGKSGVWFFISLVPFIGTIWLLVLLSMEGEKGENQYGADPKSA